MDITMNIQPVLINRRRAGEKTLYEEQIHTLGGFITGLTSENNRLPATARRLLETFWHAKKYPDRYRNFGPHYQDNRFTDDTDDTNEPPDNDRVLLEGTDAKRFAIAFTIFGSASDEDHAAALLDQVFRMTDDEVNAATPTVGTR